MKLRFVSLALSLLLVSTIVFAQKQPKISPNPFYDVSVKRIDSLGGLPMQSFVTGRMGDTILIFGGRNKGLHNFSGTGFPFNTSNKRLFVFIPGNEKVKSQVYSAGIPAGTLTTQNQLQLSATNIQYCQDMATLYCIGGFGFNGLNAQTNDSSYGTFNGFFAVQVPKLINAIVAGDTLNNRLSNYFTFSTQPNPSDSTMAVTGGELVKMGKDFYLVVGQNFQGEYNGAFYQKYTNKITRLRFTNNAAGLSYKVLTTLTDPYLNFNRRDLNVVPVIGTGGKQGIDVYGGVFTPTKNGGPYLNPIKLRTNSQSAPVYSIDTSLVQYFNQYAAAHILLYNKYTDNMFTSLLGGISLYSKVQSVNEGKVIHPKDTSMPWTKVISTISRNAAGTYTEFASDKNSLPDFIGAEAKFVPYEQFMLTGSEEIIDYNKLIAYAKKNKTSTIPIGFMFGGIISTTEGGASTNSNPSLYKVSITLKPQPLK